MAKQVIDIGSVANDGTGTPARDAFDIVNDNFTELYDADTAQATTNSNISGSDVLVKTATTGFSAERVVTDTTSVTWDWGTAAQAKANVAAEYIQDTAATMITGAPNTGITASYDDTNGLLTFTVGGSSATVPVDWKDSVAVATTANISLTAEQTIDGVLTSASRILVKNQTTGSANGIYVTAAGAWSRATDADTTGEITPGMAVFVEGGTTQADTIWYCSNVSTPTIGVTAITYAQIGLNTSFFFVIKPTGSTSYTFIITDTGKRLYFSSASAKTVTVPPTSGVALPTQTTIQVTNGGAGLLTLAAGAGVTLSSAGGRLTVPEGVTVELQKRTGNTWDVYNISNPIGKQTMYIPASAMLPAITSGPALGQAETSSVKRNIAVLDFDATTAENAHFNIPMPKSWNAGTVTFQAYWLSTATDTDGVAIGLEGTSIADNESLDAAWGTQVVVTDDAQSAASEQYITAESTAVTIAGAAAGEHAYFRVQRVVGDANDDMSEDMRLIGIRLFYTTSADTDL